MAHENPGDEFNVLVTTKEWQRFIPCVVTEHGTWRFKQDPSVMYNGVSVCAEPGSNPGQMDWNRLACDRSVSDTDRLMMHFATGYSLDGFCDLSTASLCKIETPTWTWDPFYERDIIEEMNRCLESCAASAEVENLLIRARDLLVELCEEVGR